jgi:hypothetical protein
VQELTLKLNITEVNAILNVLGQAPYIQVQALIAKIQQQATSQVQPETSKEE